LYVPWREKALYKYSSFPFLSFHFAENQKRTFLFESLFGDAPSVYKGEQHLLLLLQRVYIARTVQTSKLISQLSLTNPRDALHHGKRAANKGMTLSVINQSINQSMLYCPVEQNVTEYIATNKTQ